MRGNLMLLLTALIWGTAFVAQSKAMDYIRPLTANGIRTLLGGLVLLPLIPMFDRMKYGANGLTPERRKELNHNSIRAGFFCALCLFSAGTLQQYGLMYTTAGKSGFITALYIILVPVCGIFIKRKVPVRVWLCVLTALLGFWLLCVKEGMSINIGDILTLMCAFCYTAHILTIDHFNQQDTDGVRIACTQFLIVGAVSIILMFIFDHPSLAAIWDAKWVLIYAGIFSCSIAYTFQILGQRYTDPTIATLIMSLESVFAALSGWLILGETLSGKEFLGCVLVFIAVIFAQVPLRLPSKAR